MQGFENELLPRLHLAVCETRTIDEGLRLDCILDALASQALGRSELLLQSITTEDSPAELAQSD